MIYHLFEHGDGRIYVLGCNYDKNDQQINGEHALLIGRGNRGNMPTPASDSPFEATLGFIGFADAAVNSMDMDSSYTGVNYPVSMSQRDELPEKMVARIVKLSEQYIGEGFQDRGLVRVNAQGDGFDSIDDEAPVQANPTIFSWLLEATTDHVELEQRRRLIRDVFSSASPDDQLGFNQSEESLSSATDPGSVTLPAVLMETESFALRVNDSHQDNTLHPGDL